MEWAMTHWATRSVLGRFLPSGRGVLTVAIPHSNLRCVPSSLLLYRPTLSSRAAQVWCRCVCSTSTTAEQLT